MTLKPLGTKKWGAIAPFYCNYRYSTLALRISLTVSHAPRVLAKYRGCLWAKTRLFSRIPCPGYSAKNPIFTVQLAVLYGQQLSVEDMPNRACQTEYSTWAWPRARSHTPGRKLPEITSCTCVTLPQNRPVIQERLSHKREEYGQCDKKRR